MALMFYLIYKIINNLNNKIYIGSHKTKNKDDGYMGSGKYLNYAINKYGVENFTKEILFVFDNAKEMYDKEAEIVNDDFLAEENTYNLKRGGHGGFDYINSYGKNVYGNNGQLGYGGENLIGASARAKERRIENGSTGTYSKLLSDIQRDLYKNGKTKVWLGKELPKSMKENISAAKKNKLTGKDNSQYNTQWIVNRLLKLNKKISKSDVIPDGWEKGRVLNFDKQTKNATNKGVEKGKHRLQLANTLYDKFVHLGYTSVRKFVRDGEYSNSHVSLIKLWKKYIPNRVAHLMRNIDE